MMSQSITIEFFKKMNGIESIKIKHNDLGRYVETVAGNLHVPTQIDFNSQLYVRCFKRDNYFLSNDGKFSYDLLNGGLDFAEVVEGVFKINNSISLDLFCEMNNITKLKNSEKVSLSFIMESLGHSSIKTTMDYLAGFEDETIKKNHDVLMEGLEYGQTIKKNKSLIPT